MATSSCSQTEASPKELLLVLSILNEKQKRQNQQQQEQEEKHQDQHIDQQHQHRQQQQLEEISRQRMEWSQIELIYRAEGNANLVLALPQFKKVLRLPKISKQHEQKHLEQKTQRQQFQFYQKNSQQLEQQQQQQQGQPKQQDETNQQESNKISSTGQQENKSDANRLDKEFGGHFGLLLPDATQLPAEFDILFSKLQCKTQSSAMATIATKTSHCSNSKSRTSSSTDNSCSVSKNIFGSDTFAIEIKPKQGWLLPNDVNNLFDIKPKITQATRITQPPSLRETKKALKAAVATTMPTETKTETETKALKTSTDIQCFTTTQSEPSQTIVTAAAAAATTTSPETSLTTKEGARASTTSQAELPITSRCSCSDRMSKTTKMSGDDKISHSLYDKVDTRCRYCCMQFLKLKQQKVFERSQYCPIDLFSGISEKMFHALQALLECPQNNLRIFQNGSLVFDDQISRTMKIEELFSSDKLQLIKNLLVTCLLREYENKEEAKTEEKEENDKDNKQQPLSSEMEGVRSDRCDTNAGAESGAGVGGGCGGAAAAGQPQPSGTSSKKQKFSTTPKTIRATTTSLKETEVTKVKSTLTPAKPIFSMDNALPPSTYDYSTRCLEQITKAEVTCLPKNCVLQKILYLQLLAKINLQFMLDHKYADKREKTYNIVCKLLGKFAKAHQELTPCQLSPEEQYILAATALDCSIMITFCEIENVLEDKTQKAGGSPFMVSIFERRFLTKVTLLDLDPKPDAHFHKYFLQTQQIVDAMKEM